MSTLSTMALRCLIGAMLTAMVILPPAQACSLIRLQEEICLAPHDLPTLLLKARTAFNDEYQNQLPCYSKTLDNLIGPSEERLLAWLDDRDPAYRLLAVATLGRHSTLSQRALERLIDKLDDRDKPVADHAWRELDAFLARSGLADTMLAEFPPSVIKRIAERGAAHWSAALPVLMRVHPPLIDAVAAQLSSEYPESRQHAALLLAGQAQYLPALCSVMRDARSPYDVQQISLALAHAGHSCARDGWIRMLTMPQLGGESTCGWTEDTWSAALRELEARKEPYLHTLLRAALAEPASARSWSGDGLLWAIDHSPREQLEPNDAVLMADLFARFPAPKIARRRFSSTGPYVRSQWVPYWYSSAPVLEAMVARWISIEGDVDHAAQLGTITAAQWRQNSADTLVRINHLVIDRIVIGTPAQRTRALALLGAMHYDQVPDAAMLAVTRRALDDTHSEVAAAALVALTSFQIRGPQFREIVRGSAMFSGSDAAPLIRLLGSESVAVRESATVALGVLRVRDARIALKLISNERRRAIEFLGKMALLQIDKPTQDERLPWTRLIPKRVRDYDDE